MLRFIIVELPYINTISSAASHQCCSSWHTVKDVVIQSSFRRYLDAHYVFVFILIQLVGYDLNKLRLHLKDKKTMWHTLHWLIYYNCVRCDNCCPLFLNIAMLYKRHNEFYPIQVNRERNTIHSLMREDWDN